MYTLLPTLTYLLKFPGWNKKWSAKCPPNIWKETFVSLQDTSYFLHHNVNFINAIINYQCNCYTVVLEPNGFCIFRFGELARNWRSEEVSETAKSRCSLHELCKNNMCLWSKVILIVLIVRTMCHIIHSNY